MTVYMSHASQAMAHQQPYHYSQDDFTNPEDIIAPIALTDGQQAWTSGAENTHFFGGSQLATAMSAGPYSAVYTTAEHAWAPIPTTEAGFFNAALVTGLGNGNMAYSPAQSPGEHLAPPQLSASSESGASVHSTSSSAMGSPQLHPQYENGTWIYPATAIPLSHNQALRPEDVYGYSSGEPEANKTMSGYVDPSILGAIHPPITSPTFNYPDPTLTQPLSPHFPTFEIRSPIMRGGSVIGKAPKSPRHGHFSQLAHPYPQSRRQSTSSTMSRSSDQSDEHRSQGRRGSISNSGLCDFDGCGKMFKDLKAHQLTHLSERPEKCPLTTCEYHLKGFARKYDKNRHTLTHYKGNLVCGFCPGCGTSSEKSFNRADVFKRHLTTVHHVEQVAPNSRRKSLSARKSNAAATAADLGSPGICNTCGVSYATPQDLYEHLDDCVLRLVQKIYPTENINHKHLTAIDEDSEVKATLEKHNLIGNEFSETIEDEDEDDEDPRSAGKIKKEGGVGTWHYTGRVSKKGRPGLTLSKGGVRLAGPPGSGRKKRKNYPASWGSSAEKMKMKKRVMTVFDGPRRLWKDDLMLNSEYEVRMPLPSTEGQAYITDLDVQTMRRADAIFGASEEERGPWIPDNIIEADHEEQIFI